MWTIEHTHATTASAADLWRLWSDVATWPDWNGDVTTATIDGPFAAGSTIAMTLGSGDVIPLTLTAVEPGTAFVDEATLDGVTVRTEHSVQVAGQPGCRLVCAVTVTGEVPDEVLAEVGTGVAADIPSNLAALAAAAEG